MHKKHYPNEALIRQQGQQACKTILELVSHGVEIISVSFIKRHPQIDVKNCPGVKKIRGHFTGQGENIDGKYISKAAIINNCTVQWTEARQ